MKNKLFKILFVFAFLVIPITNVFGSTDLNGVNLYLPHIYESYVDVMDLGDMPFLDAVHTYDDSSESISLITNNSDYVFVNGGTNIYVYNVSDNSLVNTLTVSNFTLNLSVDSSYLYVSTTGGLVIYDLSDWTSTTLTYESDDYFRDVASDGSDYIYAFSSYYDGSDYTYTLVKYSIGDWTLINSKDITSDVTGGFNDIVADGSEVIVSWDGAGVYNTSLGLKTTLSNAYSYDFLTLTDSRLYIGANNKFVYYERSDWSNEIIVNSDTSFCFGAYPYGDYIVAGLNFGSSNEIRIYNRSDMSLYDYSTDVGDYPSNSFAVENNIPDPSATASHQSLMADSVELIGSLQNIDINDYSVGDLTGYFEVYKDGSLYKTSSAFDLVEHNNNVVYNLFGLKPNTGYSYKFKVEDDVNQTTWWSSEKTFTTETPAFTTSVDSKTDDSFTMTTSIDNLLISSYSSGNLVGYYHIYDSNGDLYYTTNEYDLVERDGSLQLKISGLSASSQYDYEFVVKDTSSAETALYYSNKYEVWTNSEDTSEPTYSADLSQPDAWISGSGCVSAFVTWEYENPNPDTAVLNLSIFDVVNGELNEKFGEHTFENVDSSGTEKVDFCNLDQTKVYQVEASLLVSDSEAKVRKSEITLSMEEDDWVPIFFNYMSNWFSNILIPSDPQWAVDTMNNLEDTILEPIVQFEDLFEQYHTDIENNSLDANDVLLVELTNESVSFIPEDKTLTLFSKEMLTQSGIMGNTSPTGQTWWNFLMSIVEFSFYIGLFVYLWKRIKGLLQTGVHM